MEAMNVSKWMTMTMVLGLMLTGACSTPPRCKTVTSVPAAAQTTIDMYKEGGNIHSLVMKEKHGLVLYAADVVKADGSRIEVTVDADGKLYMMERKECKHESKHECKHE